MKSHNYQSRPKASHSGSESMDIADIEDYLSKDTSIFERFSLVEVIKMLLSGKPR